jgi:hypothetical protein
MRISAEQYPIKMVRKICASVLCFLLVFLTIAPDAISSPFDDHPVLKYIDRTGKITGYAPGNEMLRHERFSQKGVAIAGSAGKVGLVDDKGKAICKPIYDDIDQFTEGLAPVIINGKFGFIDKSGAIAIEPLFDGVACFSEGLAAAEVAQKIGFVDKAGKWTIKPKFDYVEGFSEGLCYVRSNKKDFFIDKTGATAFVTDGTSNPEDSPWTPRRSPSSLSPTDPAIPETPRFRNNGVFNAQFREGLAAMCLNGKAGYIDKTGKFAIAPKFEETRPFSEGLARVKLNGKFGFINKAGKFVIEPQLLQAFDFREGLAAVELTEQHWTYINKKGKQLSTQSYYVAFPFKDKKAVVAVVDDKEKKSDLSAPR